MVSTNHPRSRHHMLAEDTPPSFRLVRFNPRRLRKNCSGAAEVEVSDGDNAVRLWMTLKDVKDNIVEYGRQPGLVAALEAYKSGAEIREGE